jgi:hypothetical protein
MISLALEVLVPSKQKWPRGQGLMGVVRPLVSQTQPGVHGIEFVNPSVGHMNPTSQGLQWSISMFGWKVPGEHSVKFRFAPAGHMAPRGHGMMS